MSERATTRSGSVRSSRSARPPQAAEAAAPQIPRRAGTSTSDSWRATVRPCVGPAPSVCESHGDGEGAGRARLEVPAGVGGLRDGECRATGQTDPQLGGCRDRRPLLRRRHPLAGIPSSASTAVAATTACLVTPRTAPRRSTAGNTCCSQHTRRQRDADRQSSTRRSYWWEMPAPVVNLDERNHAPQPQAEEPGQGLTCPLNTRSATRPEVDVPHRTRNGPPAQRTLPASLLQLDQSEVRLRRSNTVTPPLCAMKGSLDQQRPAPASPLGDAFETRITEYGMAWGFNTGSTSNLIPAPRTRGPVGLGEVGDGRDGPARSIYTPDGADQPVDQAVGEGHHRRLPYRHTAAEAGSRHERHHHAPALR